MDAIDSENRDHRHGLFANGVRVPGMVPAAQLERLLAANAQ